MKNSVDMWYGDTFLKKKYRADAYFSDTDCIYRGNIYDESGKIIGDYESSVSVWIENNFIIHWR